MGKRHERAFCIDENISLLNKIAQTHQTEQIKTYTFYSMLFTLQLKYNKNKLTTFSLLQMEFQTIIISESMQKSLLAVSFLPEKQRLRC